MGRSSAMVSFLYRCLHWCQIGSSSLSAWEVFYGGPGGQEGPFLGWGLCGVERGRFLGLG